MSLIRFCGTILLGLIISSALAFSLIILSSYLRISLITDVITYMIVLLIPSIYSIKRSKPYNKDFLYTLSISLWGTLVGFIIPIFAQSLFFSCDLFSSGFNAYSIILFFMLIIIGTIILGLTKFKRSRSYLVAFILPLTLSFSFFLLLISACF
jgi:hypothetical protein